MSKINWTLLLTMMIVVFTVLTACGGTATESNTPLAGNNTNDSALEEPANQNGSTSEETQTNANQNAETESEPAGSTAEEEADLISFVDDVNPILQSRCARCHGIDKIEGELVMLSYEELLAGGESGPVIIPGDVDNSYLAEMILAQKMPKRGPKLTPVQTQTIIDWISQGALNN